MNDKGISGVDEQGPVARQAARETSNEEQGDTTHASYLVPHALPDTYPFDADGALCREFLLERGYCCGNGCRNCPYDGNE
jgi:Family of unknown function (DUF5522)